MPARKPWCPRIAGWIKLGEALDLIKATPGSRTEQEIFNYLHTGELLAKYWRQDGKWKNAKPDDWTLDYLRKVRSVDGVEQDGKRCWYHVKISRLEELYPVIRKSGNAPLTPPRKPRRINWLFRWTGDRVRYLEGQLPPNKDDYLIELEAWILDNFDVKPETIRRGELQRFANALYAGQTERPKSTNRKAN
jgi:hypothetical protein